MNIHNFKNKHEGERCFIIGNGPGLNDIDLNLLRNEVTFGTNRIYLSGFTPSYYVCVNDLVLKQFAKDINEIEATKFIPTYKLPEFEFKDVCKIDTRVGNVDYPFFGNVEKPFWEGHTVTYVCLQLAYYMGFETAILIGVDHDYGVVKRANMEVVATGIDENHFDANYFSGGARWHTPDLRMSELAYSLAKQAYEADCRNIINASTRTKLKIFDMLPFNHVRNQDIKVSALVSAYNADRFIEGCINDLAQQSIASQMEIIIVAQKESVELETALRLSTQDDFKPAMNIIVTDDIPTVYSAWTKAAKAANGKYLTNANTDDRNHNKKYEVLANILDARPDIDLVYADSYVTWTENQTMLEFLKGLDPRSLVGGREYPGKPGYFGWLDYQKGLLSQGCFIGPHPLWRASLHQRYGYFLENFKSAGDYEFWLRCAGEANYMHVGYPLGLYYANLHGIELSQPIVSVEESELALTLHQATEMDITPLGELTRVSLGGEYCLVETEQLKNVLEKILKGV